MSDRSTPLPPATLEFLVFTTKMQAEMYLGLLHFGDDKDRPEPDFAAARHAIDLLAMLQEKTRNNLTSEEQRLLENSLTELRFRYVQSMQARKPADESSAAAGNQTAGDGE